MIKYEGKVEITLHNHTYKNCEIVLSFYHDNRPALVILTNNEVLCKASVNLPDNEILDGHIFIKNWAENEGILQELIRLNAIKDTGQTTPCGFVHAHICKLLGSIHLKGA